MRDLLLLKLKRFLENRTPSDAPLLLGCSGGPDSKALLYLLSECRRFFPLQLHLAHVDHGWREESRQEAESIAQEAEELGFPLHALRLSREDFSPGNWEEQGREQRLKFFSSIYHQIKAQALVLGHHADDQAEVVLKRVLEGSSLFSMGGLKPQAASFGMSIWRPLLSVKKQEILQWLADRKKSYFSDPTNRDSKFLRGRMREEMLPLLTASFGKQISSNLCQLGEESQEIKAFFFALNAPLLAHVQKGEGQECLDLNPFLPLPLLQLKYLLKQWLGSDVMQVSRQVLQALVAAVSNRAAGKRFAVKGGEMRVEKGVLSFSIKQNKTI